MEDDKYPRKKTGGENGDRQREPIGNRDRTDHGVSQQQVGAERVQQLPLRLGSGGFMK
jgi:hypothetical protein